MKKIRCLVAVSFIILGLFCSLAASAEQKTHELYGTLTYPDGRPASELKISVYDGSAEQQTVTDTDGRYSVTITSDVVALCAAQGDYLAKCMLQLPQNAGQKYKNDFKLESAALVLGQIVDSSTGKPVEGADVVIRRQGTPSVKTGADGVFIQQVLPRADLTIIVSKDGYATKRMNFSSENMEATAWRIKLTPEGIIRGRITDKNGSPVAGVKVKIREDDEYTRDTQTDKDGRYEIRNVDPARPARLTVDDPRAPDTDPKLVDFQRRSAENTLDWVLDIKDNSRSINGRVQDENGHLVAGATVHVGYRSYIDEDKKVQSDANGAYVINGVEPKKTMIAVQADGFAPAFMTVDDKGNQQIDVKMEKGHSAEVFVSDSSGNPLAGASVAVGVGTSAIKWVLPIPDGDLCIYNTLYNAITDEKGRAILNNLPASDVYVSLFHENYTAPSNTSIRVDSSDNYVQMKPMPQIAGTVVDAKTGAPLQDFTVEWGPVKMYWSDETRAFNHANGKFVIQTGNGWSCDESEIHVRVLADGYISEKLIVKVTEAPKVDFGNLFKLEKTFSTKGKVVDGSGKPVAGALVKITEDRAFKLQESIHYDLPSTAHLQKFVTDQDGNFTIDPLIQKNATVTVEKQGYFRGVWLNIDLTKPIQSTILASATIEIHAESLVGKDMNLRLWSLEVMPAFRAFTIYEPLQKFMKFSDLQPCSYMLDIDGEKDSLFLDIKLEPGQHYVLDLDKKLEEVHGVVTQNGRPMPHRSVTVYYEGSDYRWNSSETDDEGKYSIPVFDAKLATTVSADKGKKSVKLKSGTNTVDFEISSSSTSASISGRVIDAAGKPFPGHIFCWVQKKPDVDRYNDPYAEAVFDDNYGPVELDGTFNFDNLSGATYSLIASSDLFLTSRSLSKQIKLDENVHLKDIELKIAESGKLKVTVLDSATGKPVSDIPIMLTTVDRIPLNALSRRYESPTDVPVGKYILWIEPNDGKYAPAHSAVEILPDKTAEVTFKMKKPQQSIVFKAIKRGPFDKLNWPDRDREISHGSQILRPPIASEDRPWIGFKLIDAVTGKPVLTDSKGLKWGGYVSAFDANREASLPIKPGNYILDAVLRNTDDYKVASKVNLWAIHTKLIVTKGKDTVILIK